MAAFLAWLPRLGCESKDLSAVGILTGVLGWVTACGERAGHLKCMHFMRGRVGRSVVCWPDLCFKRQQCRGLKVGAQSFVRDIFICCQSSPPAHRAGAGLALLLLCPGQHPQAVFPGLASPVPFVHVASRAACLRLCSQRRAGGGGTGPLQPRAPRPTEPVHVLCGALVAQPACASAQGGGFVFQPFGCWGRAFCSTGRFIHRSGNVTHVLSEHLLCLRHCAECV